MFFRKNKIDKPIRRGIYYGVTSGVITVLGLLIGLFSSTNSKHVMLAGVLTVALADALSDGVGMRVSEESDNMHNKRTIWESTLSTMFAKMLLGLSFVVPVLLLPLTASVIVALAWGLTVIAVLSYIIAKQNKEKITRIIIEHVGITILVVALSYSIGLAIEAFVT
jgi:VIT1/CCC1 family predicted Fe2+/Mn2+ transporter